MSIRIGVGDGLGPRLTPQEYWDWIAYCEGAGIDSIWHSDQLLGTSLEPVTMLAALAARTTRMRFGTNAIVAPLRDPIVMAKQFASIGYMSGGRLLPIFGVGAAGDPYWAATGADAPARGQRANETIMLVRQLLEQQEVHFDGTHFRYHGPGMHPRPPRPMPLWTGGHSPAAIRRTALLGDGWLGGLMGPDAAGEARRAIETALVATGRTIDSDHYGVTLPVRIGRADDPSVIAARARFSVNATAQERDSAFEGLVAGSEDDIVERLRRYVDAGMSKFVVLPIAGSAAELMEQTRIIASRIAPAIETP